MAEPSLLRWIHDRLVIWPMRPVPELPPKPPSGGPVEAHKIAPSLDNLHPAFAEPVIGYMSQTGYELLHVREHWWTAFCRDRADLSPRAGVVEVEVRLRRVLEP